jgi:hypothetical protein
MQKLRAPRVREMSRWSNHSAMVRSTMERLKPSLSRSRLRRFFNQSDIPIIPVHFDESDTTPERLEARARELDISVEALIQRAIAEHLGAYGLPAVSTSPEPTNLSELFQAHGLLKQQQK